MNLALVNNSYRYELEKLCRIFLPFEKITFSDEPQNAPDEAVAAVMQSGDDITLFSSLSLYGQFTKREDFSLSETDGDFERECERRLATLLFHCFCEITGYTPPWGILTGVRPAKLYSRLAAQRGEKYADDYFKNVLLVSDDKTALCRLTTQKESDIISLSTPRSFSLYISIPFCPSRCSYCSFVSHSVEHAKKLIPEYIALLCEEIKLTGEIAKRLSLRLETVYIGGGTPTTLSPEELLKMLSAIRSSFDLSTLREFTVEAGRPDTFTKERLSALFSSGVDRISINPQSMNDDVLKAVGRKHTAEEIISAFSLARSVGFKNINADLIAGLPTDEPESFSRSLEKIMSLRPESITVHALAHKRASRLGASRDDARASAFASAMTSSAFSTLTKSGYIPYYMYRQSKTVGNLENVGYAVSGSECLYNVYIMDETHSIFACGASAVTKLKAPGENYIERIFNYKYPYEYISRFEQIKARKERIDSFYETHG